MTILKFKKEKAALVNDSKSFTTNNDILYSPDCQTLVHCPNTFTGHFNVPQGVVSIGIEAFAGCKGLSSVTIPESVSEIRMLAFAGCYNLLRIYNLNHKIQTIADDAFKNIDSNKCILKVPEGSAALYINNSNCKQFISIQEITLPIVEFQNYENKQAI